MADVNDLKKVGEILQPLFKDLVGLAEFDSRVSDQVVTDATNAANRLKALLESPTNNPASLVAGRAARSNAMQAVRSALVELRIQVITNNVTITPSQELLRSVMVDSLKDKIARIAGVTPLTPLTQLLTTPDIDLLKVQLEGAGQEIAQRQQAKLVLDTTVNVAIAAGKIAMLLV